MKTLIIFDFDYSLCEKNNTDPWIASKISPACRQFMHEHHHTMNFNHLMKEVINQAFTKYGYEQDWRVIKDLFQRGVASGELAIEPQLLAVLREARKSNNDGVHCKIVSDANMKSITWILEAHSQEQAPQIFDEIVSHPVILRDAADAQAKNRPIFDMTPLFPEDGVACCHECPPQMCKGAILLQICKNQPFCIEQLDRSKTQSLDVMRQEFEQNCVYDRIFYVGDGNNDFCPSSVLRQQDVVFARNGDHFKLLPRIAEADPSAIRAKLLKWHDGKQLAELMQLELLQA